MKAWHILLSTLENMLGKDTVNTWLRSLKIRKFDALNLYLEAKDLFQLNWFEEQIRPLIGSLFRNNNGIPIKVHISVPFQNSHKKKKYQVLPPQLQPTELDLTFHFTNFLVDSNNQLAFHTLKQLCEAPFTPETILGTFNPIYIYGSHSVGKTHLLAATASTLLKKGLKVFYVHANTFTHHVVNAIRSGTMELFRSTYRNIDVLIIDDIHFFSKKNATQEEFFHTFNSLHIAGKQIILSALSSPQQTEDIEPRLISRFEWGLSISLLPLSKEKVPLFLQQKEEELQLSLSKEAQEFLLATCHWHMPTIQKAMQALALRVTTKAVLSASEVSDFLKDIIEEAEKTVLSSDKIIKEVASYYGLKKEDILGKSQTRECSLPRQLAMFFCRNHLKIPFMKIGALFSRDHSTVMTAIKHIQKKIEEKDVDLMPSYLEISKKITDIP